MKKVNFLGITSVIDVYIPSVYKKTKQPVLILNAGDINSRNIVANIWTLDINKETKIPYEVDDKTCYVIYKYINASGEITISNWQECVYHTSIDKNSVLFTMLDEVVENNGSVCCQIRIFGGDSILLNTEVFEIYIEQSI